MRISPLPPIFAPHLSRLTPSLHTSHPLHSSALRNFTSHTSAPSLNRTSPPFSPCKTSHSRTARPSRHSLTPLRQVQRLQRRFTRFIAGKISENATFFHPQHRPPPISLTARKPLGWNRTWFHPRGTSNRRAHAQPQVEFSACQPSRYTFA